MDAVLEAMCDVPPEPLSEEVARRVLLAALEAAGWKDGDLEWLEGYTYLYDQDRRIMSLLRAAYRTDG